MPQETAAAEVVAATATPPARNTYIVVAAVAYTLDGNSSTPVRIRPDEILRLFRGDR